MTVTLTPCELLQPQRHQRSGIGERRDGGKMVGVGHGSKTSRDARRAPCIDNDPALSKVFGALVAADHGIEDAALRRLPEQRTCRLRRCIVETERLVERRFDQWRKVE